MNRPGDVAFDLSDAWHRAIAARDILAVDPLMLGGLLLRARHGPQRMRWLDGLAARLAPLRLQRLHPEMADESLYGAIDVAATLDAGRSVRSTGILTGAPKALLLPMAESASPGFAARLCQWLDAQAGAVIALDEGAEPAEHTPASLGERLALNVTLEGIPQAGCAFTGAPPGQIAAARKLLPRVGGLDAAAAQFVEIAAALGIDSLRAPLMAARAARAAAALAGLPAPQEPEIALATALVLAPRLRRLPETQSDEAEPESPPPPEKPQENSADDSAPSQRAPDEISVAAAMAQLPPGLLEQIAAAMTGGTRGARGGKTARKPAARGPFAPPRPGRIGGGARVDLLATLRRAAPWQPLRRRASPDATAPVLIRAEDISIARRRGRAERVAIFAVDASGSTAVGRLAECKGAIELLLAEAYRRRDHVAMVAFRGRAAEVLLPPSRSLVQTKRRLATLPGGGPTPLAAGLEQALRVAEASKRRGMDPSLVVLTDGRGNIALDGSADRKAAQADLDEIAMAVRRRALPVLLIDIGRMPRPAARALADAMDASYLPLPGFSARDLSQAVQRQWGD